MNTFGKNRETTSTKPGLSKGAKIGAILGAAVGAILVSGPMKQSGLLIQFGVFFVTNLVGMGIGSLFSLGSARQESDR